MTENFNRLAAEKSPYLLQHRSNPVHWFAWSGQAFAAAREQNKPVFLSIGYSTCYWCHVMEKESFEDEEVARVLNEHFVSIKVDREERPDVDQIYMDAVVALSGHGGWPLTVFLLPDRRPFFGCTYLPKSALIGLLQRVEHAWTHQREAVEQSSGQIIDALRQGLISASDFAVGDGTPGIFSAAYRQLETSYDPLYAGFGRAPKFPPSGALGLLLRIARRSGSRDAAHMAEHTLRCMAQGGIYDHLAGGFHRYSTDQRWLVPHFEKMLYDNALLAQVYAQGYQVSGDQLFASVSQETLQFMLAQMRSPDGGFYAALDAGEPGREGDYYVWEEEELQTLLNAEEMSALRDLYEIPAGGNFEHGRVVLALRDISLWPRKSEKTLVSIHERLRTSRAKRPRPHRDEKILAAWNGLAISALCKGYQTFGRAQYLTAAQDCARFLRASLRHSDGRLGRSWCGGLSKAQACLDDYTCLIQGLLDLYESDFSGQWFEWAGSLQAELDEALWDRTHGGYFYTEAADVADIIRKKDWFDGAVPSGNAVAALNLLRLYHFTFEAGLRERAQLLLNVFSGLARGYAQAVSWGLIALDFATDAVKEVVIAGSREHAEVARLLRGMENRFVPNKVLACLEHGEHAEQIKLLQGKEPLEEPRFYICRENTCDLPATSAEDALKKMGEYKPYPLDPV